MKNFDFIKNTEEKIDPIGVGSTHFLQNILQILPVKIQNQLVKNAAKKSPYISFVVEPYSTFLCYEITDIKWAKKLLPNNFELVKTKIFEEEEAKYYCILGCFNVKTSSFWGSRLEFNIIAKNKETNLTTWVIIDYDTNTLMYSEKKGLESKSTNKFINTTTWNGDIVIDIENSNKNRSLILNYNANYENKIRKKLDYKLWFEGNISITYGNQISKSGKTFSLMFEKQEVEYANFIDPSLVNIEKNTWYEGLYDKTLVKCVEFDYAQHFVSDNIGYVSNFKNQEDMESKKSKINFDSFTLVNAKKMVFVMVISNIITFTTIVILIILLVFKK